MLTLDLYNNTALAGTPRSTTTNEFAVEIADPHRADPQRVVVCRVLVDRNRFGEGVFDVCRRVPGRRAVVLVPGERVVVGGRRQRDQIAIALTLRSLS